MMTRRRQWSLRSTILVGGVLLAATIGLGAAVCAAPLDSPSNPGDRPGLFDPFTLSRITGTFEGGPRVNDVNARLAVEIAVRHVATKQIWVPLRPGLRSPIRPPLTS